MASLSIRLRLSLWYSGVLLLGLTLFGAGIWFALGQKLLAGVDERMAQKATAIKTVLEVEKVTTDRDQARLELSEFAKEVPDGQLIQVADGSHTILVPAETPPFFPVSWMNGEPGTRTIRHQAHSYRVLVTSFDHAGQRYSVLLATPLDEVNGVVQDFRNLVFALVPGVLLAACLGGYWVSRRALAPVDEITQVAKSISVQNLSSRLAVPQTGDELQRMSEAWNGVLERLEGAVKRIRQFTADASHELRTPVTLIRSTAELALRRERDPEEYRKALRAIEAEAKRMTELTTSLLTLARADADEVELALREIDVDSVVAEAVEQSLPLAESKGVTLTLASERRPVAACANEAGLHRLLLVLIDNALKYTPRGGSITVEVASDDDGVHLSVKDTGPGIAADALPHIFDRFFQADQARNNGGAGLGLSIAQAIARAHGTRIEVQSTLGAGSCFSLTLPVRGPELSANLQTPAVGSAEEIFR